MPCVAETERPELAGRASLDMHGGIDDPARGKCGRTPDHRYLLNYETGEVVPVRCKATNLCDYCARLAAIETSEMLLLDAMEDAPTLYVVLTARELIEKPACRRHLRQLRLALQARWPDVRWAVLTEFQKRGALHLNLMVKGVPGEDCEEFLERITALWCARVDALPSGQWADTMTSSIGVVQYLTLHFMKPAQAPPIGWRGHRFSCTRDYLVRPASVMREEARQSLRLKRLLYRGLDLVDAELELAAANAVTWELKSVGKLSRDPDRARAEAAVMPFRRSRAVPATPVPPNHGETRARAVVNPAQRATVPGRAVLASARAPDPTPRR